MIAQPLTAASAALALFVSILWGGNVVALKYGMATFPPFWSAFWRMLAAVATVALWCWATRVRMLPQRGEWRAFAILGAMFTTQISCLNVGVDWTSAAYAVVLLNSHPVFTNLYAHFQDSEDDLTKRRIAGLALAFAGICWVAFGRPDESLARRPVAGNLLMIVSANLLAVRVIYTRRLVQAADPARPVLWQMLWSLPFFFGMAWTLEPATLQAPAWRPVAAILYQGVLIAGFCFVTWTTLLRRHSAANLSMFAFSVPLFGVALSAYMFDERIGLKLLAGVALVTAGIVTVTAKRPAPNRLPADGRRTP